MKLSGGSSSERYFALCATPTIVMVRVPLRGVWPIAAPARP